MGHNVTQELKTIANKKSSRLLGRAVMPRECIEVLTWFHLMKYINCINSENINISHLSDIQSLSRWYNASSVLCQPIIIDTPLITKICVIYSLRRQTVGMSLWSTGFSSGYKPYLKTNKCAGHYTSIDYMGLCGKKLFWGLVNKHQTKSMPYFLGIQDQVIAQAVWLSRR